MERIFLQLVLPLVGNASVQFGSTRFRLWFPIFSSLIIMHIHQLTKSTSNTYPHCSRFSFNIKSIHFACYYLDSSMQMFCHKEYFRHQFDYMYCMCRYCFALLCSPQQTVVLIYFPLFFVACVCMCVCLCVGSGLSTISIRLIFKAHCSMLRCSFDSIYSNIWYNRKVESHHFHLDFFPFICLHCSPNIQFIVLVVLSFLKMEFYLVKFMFFFFFFLFHFVSNLSSFTIRLHLFQ